MRYEWIYITLFDIAAFAHANGMPGLAEKTSDFCAEAMLELQRCEHTPPADIIKISDHRSD